MKLNTISGSFFNTENTITAACSTLTLEKMIQLCGYYDRLLSKTAPGSDVMKINQAGGKPVEVNHHTSAILKLALEMYEASGGRFNIAIGSVTKLWNFSGGNQDLPEPGALADALNALDCSRIELSDDSVRVPENMQIDLGGIAKGYIADRIAEELRSCGVGSALINLGGNIVTIGHKPDGTPWRIGLQFPFTDRNYRDKFWSVLDCVNESVVTSGSYERGFHKDGRWYHHIIDPATGMPSDNGVLSVTVCAPSGFLADALTTPMFLLGEREGMKLADSYGADAAFYLSDNSVVISPGMANRISEPAGDTPNK